MLTFVTLFALLSAASCQVYRGESINDRAMNFLVRVTARYQGGQPNSYVGGGTIVSPRMVLTAAHVVMRNENFQRLPHEVEVVAGTKCLGDTPKSGVQVQTVFNDRVHVFPRYRNLENFQFDQRFDVALIVLVKPLRLGPMVQVANMGQPPMNNQHQCWVMGWGATSKLVPGQNGHLVDQIEESPRVAKIGRVRMLDPTRCETTAIGNYFTRTHHACYGCNPGDYPCPQPGLGDSGGPVVCERDGVEHVVAVHSAGCDVRGRMCNPDMPSAGVRITRGLREWMKFVGEWQEEQDGIRKPRYTCTLHTGVMGNRGFNLDSNYVNEVCRQTH